MQGQAVALLERQDIVLGWKDQFEEKENEFEVGSRMDNDEA